MSKYFNEFDTLFAKLDEGTLLLTPNMRLARVLIAQYGLYQKKYSASAWSTLNCMGVRTWMSELWEARVFLGTGVYPRILSASEETSLWLEIVNQDEDAPELFSASAAATVARRAWHSLVLWQAESELGEDAEVLLRWLTAFRQKCASLNVIDEPSAQSLLVEHCANGDVKLPQKLILFGFDDIPPLHQCFIDTVERQGCSVVEYDAVQSATMSRRIGLVNTDAEIVASARWAHKHLAEDASLKIGIVVPQLTSLRGKIERIYSQVFEPQYILPGQARHASGFNISAAVPLSDTPPVAAALLALKLNHFSLDVEQISQLLHSPFIGDNNELADRANFDVDLREEAMEVRVSHLRALAGEWRKTQKVDEEIEVPLADLYSRLQRLQKSKIGIPKKQAPSAWGALFKTQLSELGWPGNRKLDTLEYQQVEVWQGCYSQLNAFDYLFSDITLTQALEILERLSFDTQFQAQTQDSPIQILGTLEAAGMHFDMLWVMNFDNETWPAPINPNALLPLKLQKEKAMPMASAERERQLATKITRRFQQSARTIIFSHAMLDGDKELKPSPLIESLELLPKLDNLVLTSHYWPLVRAASDCEAFVDACGPVVENPKNIKGGTAILKDQAACPFKAFATHRLAAKSLFPATPGLSPAERGSLVHSVLELLWKKLRHQERLLEIKADDLHQLVIEIIEKSFHLLDLNKKVGAQLKTLEVERMLKLVDQWLNLEKKRAPFSVIFSETKRTLHLAKLPIHLRYDRVDKLEDGSLFIVDYKTSKLNIKSWEGPRPDEPQVPLYGVANKSKVSGVAYGQINVDEIAYKGISQHEEVLKEIVQPESISRIDLPNNWEDVLDQWERILEKLAQEFVAGVADVRPKRPDINCRYCQLQSLCRIKEFIDDTPSDSEGER